MRQVRILNRTRPLKTPLVAEYCTSFTSKLRGLALRRELQPERGLVLVESGESRLNTGIHMLGMSFDLSIAWLDNEMKVVDTGRARRWRSFLMPRKAARYVIEFHASRFEEFQIGDQAVFEDSDRP